MSTPLDITVDTPLDTVARVIAPERILLEFPLAGPGRRLFAYLIDQIALVGLIVGAFLATVMATGGSGSGLGLGLVAYFVLSWGYGAFCEGLLGGQTLGKRSLGLRVISDQGAPIGLARAITRNVVGAVDGPAPFFFMLGFSSMVLSGRFQRLGDLAAGTIVVALERKDRTPVERPREAEVLEIMEWLPLRIEGSARLERALSDYAAERHQFAPARRAEMAEPLARVLRHRYQFPAETRADVVLVAVHARLSGLA